MIWLISGASRWRQAAAESGSSLGRTTGDSDLGVEAVLGTQRRWTGVRASDETHGSNRFAPARISLALDRDHAARAMGPSADGRPWSTPGRRPIRDAMDG